MALIDEALKRGPRNNSFGDAAAAMSNPNVTQVQTARAPTTAQSAAAQMTTLPGAAPVSLASRASQIPAGGPMAPPKVNSFGDAAAVARGASTALPSAAALSMGTAPQASPQVTTLEARKAVGLFPYSSPDAGKNIYAGFGLGKGGEQQAAPNDSRRIDALVSQIPGNGGAPAPAADGSQEQWRNTELGRNANNAMMALPGIGGIARVASTGGAISSGFNNAAAPGINAASRMMALGTGVAASGPATPAAANITAPNPYASVTPEQGRAMAEINANAQSPTSAPQPRSLAAMAMQSIGGITRIDRPGHSPLFTDNKDPDMARFLARPAGGPTKEVSSIMQRMSDQSQNEAFGRFQKEANAAQYTREVQQAQAINAAAGEHARTVQNRMDQEKYLRTLDAKGSSKAYHAALAQDAGFRAGADAGSVARTQNEGAAARERMQQAGSTARAQMQEIGQGSRFGQTQGVALSKLAMEQETQGFSNRAAAQSEQLRNQIMQEQDPTKRQSAVQRMRDLSGTQQADPYLVVQGGQQVDENGKAYNMPSSVFNRQSGQFVQQPGQRRSAAQALRTIP